METAPHPLDRLRSWAACVARLPGLVAVPVVLVLSVLSVLSGAALAADLTEADGEGPGAETGTASGGALPQPDERTAPTPQPKWSFHGYLSQAWGTSQDFPTQGLPTDGTADYRTAALLLRYDVTANDSLTVQLSHEAQGESPFDTLREDVEIDWAFYEHHFKGETSLRVGRVPIPKGIFNELRDVGTLLPFFRPPVTFYTEGFFASEQLDGVVLSQVLAARSLWKVDLDLYYGSWEIFQFSLNRAEVEDAVGGQVWLHTPISGLRIGGGVVHQDMEGLDTRVPAEKESWYEWHASLEGDLSRFLVRLEGRHLDFEVGGLDAFYVQLGLKASPKLTFNTQFEASDITVVQDPFGLIRADLHRDYALGINYAFHPELILKLEHHWTESLMVDLDASEVLARVAANDPFNADYLILSLSFSF